MSKIQIIPMSIDMIQKFGKILEIPEIRVWCHPQKGGDDYYVKFLSFESALDFIQDSKKNRSIYAEDVPLIAFRGFEINIYALRKGKV